MKFLLDDYSQNYEREFERACREYANELLGNSGVDLEQNRKTVQAHGEQMSAYYESEKKRRIFNGLFIAAIAVAVIVFIAFILAAFSCMANDNSALGITFFVFSVVVPVALVTVAFEYLKKKREFYKQKAHGHASRADALEQEGLNQLQPFNDSFNTGDTHELISRVMPVLKFVSPDNRRYDYFTGKFGFWISGDIADDYEAWATENAICGSVYGNPFLSYRERICKWGERDYSNSIEIEWTEEERDSDGEWHTEHHSETLVATVTKPIPVFHRLTRTVCGSNGSELSFARVPRNTKPLKLIAQHLISSDFYIVAPSRKKSTESEQQTERFCSSFGDCPDLDGYKEFFSAESQKNIRKILNGYYGDDLIFYKHGNLNCVASAHAQNQSRDTHYTRYASFDYEQTINNFVEFNCGYLKSLVYDLSAAMAAGGEYGYSDYVYAESYNRNYSPIEAECVLQNMPPEILAPEGAATELILMPMFLRRDGACDELSVAVHSYSAEDCVDVIRKHGGDGYWHDIEVVWQDYNLLDCTRIVKIKSLPTTDKKFDEFTKNAEVKNQLAQITKGYGFYDGFFCCVVDVNTPIDSRLNEIFKPLLGE